MRYLTWPLAIIAALVLPVGVASASVVNGGITAGGSLTQGGVFVQLNPAVPFTVGLNNFQTPNLYAFNEDQNISIGSTIAVDVGVSPMAGDIVASHYVFFDPNGFTSQAGFVEFDANIYGIATSTTNLFASDFLANTAVTYLSPTLRGLEANDIVSIDPMNAKRLLVDWDAGTPGDYVRVFTRQSPMAAIPVPAGGMLLLSGLGMFAALRRRRAR